MKRRKWFDRAFVLELPTEQLPETIERLRGTPTRLEERLRAIAPAVRVRRSGEAWSIQEHAGHLLDLESLWRTRLEQMLGGAETIEPADLTNRRTFEAGHNERDLEAILADFRRVRGEFVARLEGLEDAQLGARALHPRLRQPMNVTGLAYFVAEHDDHHLARVTEELGRR